MGSFGAGMGLHVAYLLTAFSLRDLDQITLVEELPGSDDWPVRDLFQRDIDHHRVKHQILPWLRDGQRIKFLPPVVLALIPRSGDLKHVAKEIPAGDSLAPDLEGSSSRLSAVEGLFDFQRSGSSDAVGTLAWHPSKCWMVALDGQHRIASLRLWQSLSHNDSPRDWTVPAIILAASRRGMAAGRQPSQLDFARSVFVYINTQARSPSQARQILLDDSNPHAMITQEVVERAQARGAADLSDRLPSIALVSWRDNDSRLASDGHRLFGVEEINSWIAELLLPPYQSDSDATRRLLGSKDPVVISWLKTLQVPAAQADEYRHLVINSVVPAIEVICAGTQPIAAFSSYLRAEIRKLVESGGEDSGSLRLFATGGSRSGVSNAAISEATNAVLRMQPIRQRMPIHFREAIGMRSVISGLRISASYADFHVAPGNAVRFAESYIAALNSRLEQGWLVDDDHECPNKYLRHITRSHDGKVKNYRFESIPSAGGALCALLASSELFGANTAQTATIVREVARKTLFETIRGGFVSELRAQLKDSRRNWSTGQIKDEAQRQALQAAHRQVDHLLHEMGMNTA